MSETITNLKVRFGADTKQFKKGMDDATVSANQFKKDAGGALDSFAAAFGVNLSEIRDGVNSFKSSLLGINAGFKAAAVGTGGFTKAMQILKVALISTGVGALVVALGSLVAYFTRTERGAEGLQRVMAGFKAVFDVLIDRVALFGEGIFKIFTGDFKGGWDALKSSVQGVGLEMAMEADAAFKLERRLQELEDREIALIEVQSEREKRIAEARRLATDETADAKTKLAAIQEAFKLEKQTLDENKSMQKERIDIMQQQFEMGQKLDDDLRSLNEEKAKLNQLDTESSMAQKTLQKDLKRVNNEIEAQTVALKKQQEQIIENRAKENLGDNGKDLEKIKTLGLQLDLSTPTLEFDKLAANIKQGLEPAKALIIDFADTFNQTFTDLGEGLGEGLGQLLSGAEGFKGFGAIILGSLGDLAIKVGKMAVATGVAVLGIKQALISLNPVIAIAGGIALIAIGTLIKGSLAGAANGSSGGGTYSGNTAGGGTFDTRTFATGAGAKAEPQPIAITITGEFRQRGTDLVATVNETNKRSGYRG